MEEYIEMCDCEEIQGRWEPKKGDVFHFKGRTDVICGENFGCAYRNDPEELKAYPHMKEYYFEAIRQFEGGYEWEDSLVCHKGDAIWLPTQAQLQEMVERDSLDVLIQDFYEFSMIYNPETNKDQFTSMEQLWLAFVMYECHGKVWREGKWK